MTVGIMDDAPSDMGEIGKSLNRNPYGQQAFSNPCHIAKGGK
jgi:hypothetical protein